MKSIIDDLRRENNELRGEDVKKTEQLAVLEKKLKISEVELEKANNKIEAWETECKNHDDWVSKVYKSMSVDGRAEFKNAFTVAAPSLKRGTISRLRKTTKLNFSDRTTISNEEESDLKRKIAQFALENTIDVPDKKKFLVGARFKTASLLSLYNTFEVQYPSQCTYTTFTRYWPEMYVRPKPSDFGTCLCITCQDLELKVEALINRKLIGKDQPGYGLDSVILHSRNGDFELENEFKKDIAKLDDEETRGVDVGFLQWDKVKQTDLSKNTGRAKSDKTQRLPRHLPAGELGKIVLKDYEDYKEHLERDYVLKNEIKKVRLEAMNEDDLAVLHIDWGEQHQVTEIREVQSAFFAGRYAYDLHTGYCYTKEDSHGFVSLSDSSDHKAESVH